MYNVIGRIIELILDLVITAATGRRSLLTLTQPAYFTIHCRAIAHDKQSIRAQIILASENPRLSSLPRRRSDLTARYLSTNYRMLAR